MAVAQTVKKELGLAQFTAAGLKKRMAAQNWTWAAEECDALSERGAGGADCRGREVSMSRHGGLERDEAWVQDERART